MIELLKSFWELLLIYWGVSPLGTILTILGVIFILKLMFGIYKKGTEEEKPSTDCPSHSA